MVDKKDNTSRPRGVGSFSSQALFAQQSKAIQSAEEVSVTLNPGHNKGPNHPYLPIDNFIKNIQPMQWNNIPVPLCETISEVQSVFKAIKQSIHDNYNDIVMTQRVVNINQRGIARTAMETKLEMQEEI